MIEYGYCVGGDWRSSSSSKTAPEKIGLVGRLTTRGDVFWLGKRVRGQYLVYTNKHKEGNTRQEGKTKGYRLR